MDATNSAERDASRIAYLVSALALAHLYPAITDSSVLWGLGFPSALPPFLLYCVVGILVLVSLPAAQKLLAHSRSTEGTWLDRKNIWSAGLASAFLFLIFVLLRQQNLILGDAYSIIERTLQGNDFAPFSAVNLYLQKGILAFTGHADPNSIILAYRLTSWLAGAIVLGALWRFSATTGQFLVAAAALLATALIQVFCGYVERYPIAYAVLFVYCLIAYRDFQARRASLAGTICLLAAILLHFAAGVLVPSFLILVIRKYRTRSAVVLSIAAAFVLLVLAVLYARSVAGPGSAFLPFLPQEERPYAFFTIEHWIDHLNIILLTAPLMIALAFTRRFWRKEIVIFHLVMLIPAWLFILAVDPKLGALRDWDLLALFAVPALAATITVLWEILTVAPRALTVTVLVIVLFGVLRTGSWVGLNSRAMPAYEAMKGVIASDLHYASTADQGLMNVAWARIVQSVYNDGLEGVAAQERRLAGDPSDSRNRYNLAVNQAKLGNHSRAEELVVGHWQEFDLNQRTVSRIADILRRRGNRSELQRLLEAAVARDPGNSVFAPELESLKGQ